MEDSTTFKTLHRDGFFISNQSIATAIIQNIEKHLNSYFKNEPTTDQHAIRQLFKNIPDLKILLEIPVVRQLINSDFFLTKSIYFNKPALSNWFVPYHQDLSISVKEKIETENYKSWTFKKGQYGVIPPQKVLENTITVRIHLDDTDERNGALRIIKGSHSSGVLTREQIQKADSSKEVICNVKKDGFMLMKPLLLHASNKSTSSNDRRVIHLEFCNQELDGELEWLER